MKTFAYVISAFVFVALGALYGAACWFDYGLWAIAFWIAMIIAIPISSLLHELGHMLFGAICKIKAKPQFSIFGSSSCEIIPRISENLKTRVIVTALGGVIVNFSIVCLLTLLVGFGVIPKNCAFLIPANAYLTILNVIPVRLAAGKTDGLVVCELINNDDNAKVMLAVLNVQAGILNGTPINQIDKNLLFDVPQIQEDEPAFISLTELRYEYFKAIGDTAQANKYKSRFEELKKEYM